MRKFVDSARVFCVIAILLLAGCFIAQELGLFPQDTHRFSHKLHEKDKELECQSCHTEVANQDKPAIPSQKKCMTCHEGIDENKPPEKKAASLFKDGQPQWAHVTDLPDDVTFSHKGHVTAKIECTECHKGIETSDAITPAVRVRMNDCIRCHAQKGISATTTAQAGATDGCRVCHKTLNQETPPPNHKMNWKQLHGDIVRMKDSDTTQHQCSLCHTESHCTACHQDQAPKNHTDFWRHRGHGVTAGIDRSRCETCHRADSCDRCHSETAPRSHNARWASPVNNHCNACHLPASSGYSGCLTCHRSTGHSSAPARPGNAFHLPNSNCRGCHIRIHPDNGDSCISCHF